VTAREEAPLLDVREVSRRFGGVHALRSVTVTVARGEILGLLGANGSGKTTLLNIISGVYRPSSGAIDFRGVGIAGKAPDAIASLGIARTFQQAMTFPGISVWDNLRTVTRDEERIVGVIDRLGLAEQLRMAAGSLSHGTQRLLGVGLALLTRPALLLLDEPAAGLSSDDVAMLSELLAGLRADGMTIVVIDHDMSFVLPLSDRVVVLNAGELLFTGSPAAMRENALVQQAYLGTTA
jgi:ABC-type branched-subunit amino acid transport system ATPase component